MCHNSRTKEPTLMSTEPNKDLEVLLGDLGFPVGQLHRFVVDGMTEGIWVTDPEGNTVFANQNFAKMLNFSPSELLKKHIVELILFDDKTPTAIFVNPTLGGHRTRQDVQLLQKGGTPVWVMMGMSPLFGKDSQFLGTLFMVMDISEIKRSELELKRNRDHLFETSKLATIGEMSAGMAHEMNQPMTGITLAVAMIKKLKEKNKLTDEELDSALKDILTSVKRCTKVIDHVRAFSRQQTEDFGPISVNDSIDAAMILMKESLRLRNIEVTKTLTENLPEIRGERFQLEQVWINLISNAKDALDELEAKSPGILKNKKLSISSRLEAGAVVVEITDTGIGMSEKTKNKIFEPFFTTKPPGKGTGLGMSIVHGIIQAHKAEVEIKSKVGSGSTFSIRLPAV